MEKNFWKNKRVFLTGHTGFKGSWLVLYLHQLGAKITGFSLPPSTDPSFFLKAQLKNFYHRHIEGNITNLSLLQEAVKESNPQIIIHMAAQGIVRESYLNPVETYASNVMGTVNILEAARTSASSELRSFVNVTTDKCYYNKEWSWPYRENDELGGKDPYSNSKSCSELVTASYRHSFFNPADFEKKHNLNLATARAGNVVGGGDWADYRLLPDCMRSFSKNEEVSLRFPRAIRPWQIVFAPLEGYLTLAERLYQNRPHQEDESYNFSPQSNDGPATVEKVVSLAAQHWGDGASYSVHQGDDFPEANFLQLDSSRAQSRLNWKARWDLETTIKETTLWYKNYYSSSREIVPFSLEQLQKYLNH